MSDVNVDIYRYFFVRVKEIFDQIQSGVLVECVLYKLDRLYRDLLEWRELEHIAIDVAHAHSHLEHMELANWHDDWNGYDRISTWSTALPGSPEYQPYWASQI